MKLSSKADKILEQINSKTKPGDLRKMAKDIKKDHELALELWSTGRFLPRQLGIRYVKGTKKGLKNHNEIQSRIRPFAIVRL